MPEESMVESPEVSAPPPVQVVKSEARSIILGAALYLAFYTGMVLFNIYPPKLSPLLWALLAPLSTVLYLLLLTYTLRLFCRLSIRPGLETLLMLGTLLLLLILNPAIRDAAWLLLKGRSWNEAFSQLTSTADDDKSLVGIILQILVPFFLILTGALFGQIIARLIRDRSMLVPVGIIAGLVDFWGVFWGPVGKWSETAPALVGKMATASTAASTSPAPSRCRRNWRCSAISPPCHPLASAILSFSPSSSPARIALVFPPNVRCGASSAGCCSRR